MSTTIPSYSARLLIGRPSYYTCLSGSATIQGGQPTFQRYIEKRLEQHYSVCTWLIKWDVFKNHETIIIRKWFYTRSN